MPDPTPPEAPDTTDQEQQPDELAIVTECRTLLLRRFHDLLKDPEAKLTASMLDAIRRFIGDEGERLEQEAERVKKEEPRVHDYPFPPVDPDAPNPWRDDEPAEDGPKGYPDLGGGGLS